MEKGIVAGVGWWSGGVGAALALGIGAGPARAAVPVATRNQAAPGMGAGMTFGGFATRPVLGSTGQATFQVGLVGPGVTSTNSSSLWVGTPGDIRIFARRGDPLPGVTDGSRYLTFNESVVNAAGTVAFVSRQAAGDSAMFVGKPGALELVARTGTPAPGAAANLDIINEVPALNDAGQLAFSGTLAGGAAAVWVGEPGSLRPVGLSGTPAPYLPDGVSFRHILSTPGLNDAGQVTFLARVTGTGVTGNNDQVVYAGAPDALAVAARVGLPAPGTGPGVAYGAFASFSVPVLNDAGQVAFRTSLVGTGVTAANDAGVWLGAPGAVRLVAREGAQIPGEADGVKFQTLNHPALNDRGQVAFTAQISGRGEGIFLGDADGLDLIIESGKQAPGAPPGVTLSANTSPLMLNNRGQVAFMSALSGLPLTSRGIWAADGNSVLLVGYVGGLFDVGGGVFKTINILDYASSNGGRFDMPSPLNDAGQLAIYAGFTDGTQGVFLVQVPEPAGAAGVLLGLCALARRVRRA